MFPTRFIIPGAAWPRPELYTPASHILSYVGRLFALCTKAKRVEQQKFKTFCRKKIKHLFEMGYWQPLEVLPDFAYWLGTTHYSDKMKRSFADLYQFMKVRGIRHSKTNVKSFVKVENYETFKFPRMINARCDQAKVYLGPIFKAIEERVYVLAAFMKHRTDRMQHVTRMMSALGQFVLELPSVSGLHYDYYVTDHSSFEAFISKEVMECVELNVYRHFLQRFPDVFRFVRKTLSGTNKMKSGCVRASRLAGRMSGDMCTSLGNGLTNLFAAWYVLEEKCKTSFSLVVEGDDGLIAVPRDTQISKSYFEELGFTIKMNKVRGPQVSGFCGMNYAIESGCNVEFKDFRKVLCTLPYDDKELSPKKSDERLRAKALSLLFEGPSSPVTSVYARSILARTRGDAVFPTDWWTKQKLSNAAKFLIEETGLRCTTVEKLIPTLVPISDYVRYEYHRRFGISPREQLWLEERFMNGEYSHPGILAYMTRDSLLYGSGHRLA